MSVIILIIVYHHTTTHEEGSIIYNNNNSKHSYCQKNHWKYELAALLILSFISSIGETQNYFFSSLYGGYIDITVQWHPFCSIQFFSLSLCASSNSFSLQWPTPTSGYCSTFFCRVYQFIFIKKIWELIYGKFYIMENCRVVVWVM